MRKLNVFIIGKINRPSEEVFLRENMSTSEEEKDNEDEDEGRKEKG